MRLFLHLTDSGGFSCGAAVRKLYIHAGTPKTGTSTFQRFLAHNCETLHERGLFVPPFGTDADMAHHPLASSLFANELEGRDGDLVDQFWDTLAKKSDCDVLISSETIATLLIEKDPQRFRMNRLVEKADELGLEIVPIVVVRDPLDYHESAYSQLAKNFMAATSFEDYLFEKTWNPTYLSAQVMVPLELNPHNNIVIPLNGETKAKGIECSLVSALGVAWDGLEPVERVNEGVGICQVAVALALAGHFLADTPIYVAQAALCGSVVERATRSFMKNDPVYKPMNAEMAAVVEQTYAPHCEDFARYHWGKGWYDVFERTVENRRSATIDHFAFRKEHRPNAWDILLRSYAEIFGILTDEALIERCGGGPLIDARSKLRGSALVAGDGYSMDLVESRLSQWGYAIAS